MRTALLLLFLASPLWAADIEAPATAPEHSLVELRTPAEGRGFAWFVTGPQGFVKTVVDSGDRSRAVFTGPPGKYAVMLVVSLPDGTLDQGQAIVVIGNAPLPPTPPDPPGPPTPPGPVDPTKPLKVLILLDKQAPNDPWQDVLGAREVEEYLNAKCGKDGWFAFDDKQVFTNIHAEWKAIHAAALPHWKTQPMVFFVRGSDVRKADLPDTVPAAMALLKQFGG